MAILLGTYENMCREVLFYDENREQVSKGKTKAFRKLFIASNLNFHIAIKVSFHKKFKLSTAAKLAGPSSQNFVTANFGLGHEEVIRLAIEKKSFYN